MRCARINSVEQGFVSLELLEGLERGLMIAPVDNTGTCRLHQVLVKEAQLLDVLKLVVYAGTELEGLFMVTPSVVQIPIFRNMKPLDYQPLTTLCKHSFPCQQQPG